jgi:hypothetical protein
MAKAQTGVVIDFGSEWLRSELVLGLLSEDSPQALVSISEDRFNDLSKNCAKKVPLIRVGCIRGDSFLVSHQGDQILSLPKDRLINCFNHDLENFLAKI